MDEQKRTDPQEQEQEQERKIDDLEVPDEQGDAVKGGQDRPGRPDPHPNISN